MMLGWSKYDSLREVCAELEPANLHVQTLAIAMSAKHL
jgi:hypothetical protein